MYKRVLIAAMAVVACASAPAVNPFLPLWEHIPDGEPYVFDDPDNPGKQRVYVYGSHDTLRSEYCGNDLVVWSAPVDNLEKWRFDGIIFESLLDGTGTQLSDQGDVLYAPDVAEVTDANGSKTYYLYPNNQSAGRQGMIAKSDRPDGPFVVCNWDGASPDQTYGILGFDPAVLVDDDGRVYGYWGFDRSFAAELDPTTMCTVKPGTEVVEDLVSSRTQEGEARFFEASSIRKVQDKYVFVYSRWTAEGEEGLGDSNYTLAYAYSERPLGPYTYGGTIIDARAPEMQPGGKVAPTTVPYGNTHGSICEADGQWWVFYHRQTGTNEFSRQAMVAPISIEVEPGPGGAVVITPAEYTSEGFMTIGLPLRGAYPAGIASRLMGPTPVKRAYPNFTFSGPYVEATYYDDDPTFAPSDVELRSAPVVNNTAGSLIGYKYFNFNTLYGADTKAMYIDLVPKGIDGVIEIYAGGTPAAGGKKVGQVAVSKYDEPGEPVTKMAMLSGLNGLEGKQELVLAIKSPTRGKSIADIYSFKFQ